MSQLDMYLEKVAGLKKKHRTRKWLFKSKKSRGSQKTLLQLQQPYTDNINARTSAATNLVPTPQPLPPTQSKLVVIPWGGQTILLGTSVSLTHTCPIDNSLMILHSLTNKSVQIGSYQENNKLVAQTLCKSLKLVENCKYAEAKLEWIKGCSPFQVGPNGIFDLWGNKANMFTWYLIPLMKSCVTTNCSSLFCRLP